MILSKSVKIKPHKKVDYYKNKGYTIERPSDYITVNTHDLSEGSECIISVQCDVCGHIKEISYRKYLKNISNGNFYSCSITCSKEKIKNTYIDKYNVEHPSKLKEFKQKKIEYNLQKWGVEHYSQTNEYKEKYLNTMMEKWGVTHPSKSLEIKENNKIKLEDKREKFYRELLSDEYNILKYFDKTIELQHLKCNNTFTITSNMLYDRNKVNSNFICLSCYPIKEHKSLKENDIKDFLLDNNIDFKVNDRIILNGKELDIYIPNHNLAIEFNGLYWHSELFKEKSYHLDKTTLSEKANIQLLHIFEDDWTFKKDIVKSILLNRLGLITNRIYARNCEIKSVKPVEATIFLNNNHIQGSCKSKYKIGLYYKDELVSLMTFGYRKTNTKKEFELIRFCNKINLNVIGASSKLFKYFIKQYHIPEKYLISYSDYSLFNGKMYELLGFKKIHLSKPNYFWCYNNRRFHRYVFNKSKLIKDGYDASKSENEIMTERGYFKIWSCGQVRWEYHL